MARSVSTLDILAKWDHEWTRRINHVGTFLWGRRLFCSVSRLSDGIFWYVLMIWLLIRYGKLAMYPVLHMVLVGLTNVILYKALKNKISRPRPFRQSPLISCFIAPLDEHSFPSGHAMHAFAFGIVSCIYYPELMWIIVPFAALVSMSRVVLGIHYPSDVVVGATLGTAVALASFSHVLRFFT